MPTTATDLRYGRRGGGWVPRGAGQPPPAVPCDVCGRPAYFAARHRDCEPGGEAADDELGDGQLLLSL